jgi:hypothetical protein
MLLIKKQLTWKLFIYWYLMSFFHKKMSQNVWATIMPFGPVTLMFYWPDSKKFIQSFSLPRIDCDHITYIAYKTEVIAWCHNIAEILLKLALNTNQSIKLYTFVHVFCMTVSDSLLFFVKSGMFQTQVTSPGLIYMSYKYL